MKKMMILFLAMIFLASMAHAYSTNQLKYYYKFDENTGTTAFETLGRDNLTGLTGSWNSSGLINSARNVSNADGYNSAINFSGQFSIVTWIKRTGVLTTYDYGYHYSTAQNPTQNGDFRIHVSDASANAIELDYRDSAGRNANFDSGVLPLQQWTMLVFTMNSSTAQIWFNSSLNNTVALNAYNPALNALGLKFWRDNLAVNGMRNSLWDEVSIWNKTLNTSDIAQLYNNGNGLSYEQINGIGSNISVALNIPMNTSFISDVGTNFTATYTATALNFTNATFFVWNSTGLVNRTRVNVTGQILNSSTLFIDDFNNPDVYTWNVLACGINGTGSVCAFAPSNNTFVLGISNIVQSYDNSTFSGNTENFSINFTIASGVTISGISLIYNNTAYTPTLISDGQNYSATATLQVPLVLVQRNIPFYWNIIFQGGFTISTVSLNQTVQAISISTNCSAGTFLLLNITNYDEETLLNMNGTVEYILSFLNNNINIGQVNGSIFGANATLCSSQNLSTSSAAYSIQLRYYASGYMFETYNIQSNAGTTIPLSIPLYFLTNSTGVQFNINYVDFNYITHPGAIVQVQRQYLATNTYLVTEIPLIDNDGLSKGSFNPNNIKYKIIILKDGVVLDTFNDIFPTCQSVILGTCNINLRGAKTSSTQTSDDFTYTLTNSNGLITLTYVIPSGTPKSVNFYTNQNSRFLSDISTCNTTVFASGGTITCGYNSTVGDSLVSTQVNVNGIPSLFGNIPIAEDLNAFFLGNNYFIAFILILALVLMFMGSAVIQLIVAGIGVLYLGMIFLIKGVGLGIIATSFGWLIVAIVIAIYKINQHEEKYN